MERSSTFMLLLTAVIYTSLVSAQVPETEPRAWPCPTGDISPCICEVNQEPIELKVSCMGINETRLAEVFQMGFAFKSFTSFVVTDSHLETLIADVFNGISFKSMVFQNSGLQEVETNAFMPSHKTLESLSITEAKEPGKNFPWPLNDLENFEVLGELVLNGPFEAPTALASTSLTKVTISIPTIQSLKASLFQGLQVVTSLSLEGPVSSIESNTFNDLVNLEELTISEGEMTTNVVKDAFNIGSASLVSLDLSNNGIAGLDDGAIVVTNENIVIDLSQNQLSMVRHEVFEPILTVVENGAGIVKLEDNPLLCGCDLYWIVKLVEAQQKKLSGVTESCNVEGIDTDVLADFLDFQCSPETGDESK